MRVTTLQALNDHNVDGRHIVRVSGHKNLGSMKSYARKLSAAKKRKISSILSGIVDDGQLEREKQPTMAPITTEKPVLPPQQPLSFSYFGNEADNNVDFLLSTIEVPTLPTIQVQTSTNSAPPPLPSLPLCFNQTQPLR